MADDLCHHPATFMNANGADQTVLACQDSLVRTIEYFYSIVVESSDCDQFRMLAHTLQVALDLYTVDRVHYDD